MNTERTARLTRLDRRSEPARSLSLWVALAVTLSLAPAACAPAPERVAIAPLPEAAEPPAGTAAADGRGSGDERIVILPVAAVGVPLFPEELEVARAGVAAFLSTALAPRQVIRLAEVDTLVSLAEEGRVRPGGAACPLAPTLESLIVGAYGPEVWRAHTTVDCHGGPCELRLTVLRPPPGGRPGAYAEAGRWRAPVSDPFDPEALDDAVFELTAATAEREGTGRLERIPTGLSRARVQILRIDAAGVWSPVPTPESLAPHQEALDACHVAGLDAAGPDYVTLAVEADGTVSRCAIDPWLDPPLPERARCICATFGEVRFPAGSAGRRIQIALADSAEDGIAGARGRVRADVKNVRSADPFPVEAALDRAGQRIAACGARADLPLPLRLELRARIDPAGELTALSIGPDSSTTPALEACLEGALRAVPLPCPVHGRGVTVEGAIEIRASASTPAR